MFALLRGNSSENFCHIVLTQQGVRDRRRGKKGLSEEKKRGEKKSVYSLFLPSSTQSFPSLFVHSVVYALCVCVSVCLCVCVHTSLAHLNLLLITSHTSRLSGGLLTVEDYQAAGAF